MSFLYGFRSINKIKFCYFLLVLVFFVATCSRLLFNGQIFEFDFGIYQPDGAHYTFRTLLFLGVPDVEAASRVIDWYRIHSVDTKHLTIENLVPATNPLWGLSLPRIIYPLLSTLPVLVFGIPGMLFMPIASLLILVLVIQSISSSMKKPYLGLAINFVLLSSPTLLRWMVANCTDSILVGFFALYLWIYLMIPDSKKKDLVTLVLIMVTSFTRFCLPIWVALFFSYYLQSKRIGRTAFWIVISILISLPAVLTQPGGNSAFLPERNGTSFFSKLLFMPQSFVRVGFIEIAELAVLDRLLLFLLILSFVFALRNFRNFESKLFFSVLFSVWSLGAINGVLGVNFRYQLPVIPFLALVLLSNIRELDLKRKDS